ncbi:hypothetical protein H696_02338 [Fonticula alba]|uniref:GINS subunit domain-containing protein n=1 Tax=Fonticula alba TaxID=691883 RepID=A0A058ZBT9_FONAL|nr:hypothetical protein, variant [Fonticula alba]XP_009494512.1 hypothetical protein H696_02338 [Fonticula alba]KCV71388.1 hypothetical protein H696_02338 [Fonticula alba]KCV71389.1 hypothetical protein, variant [Fonticula alba]|eukprot:XP_009494511.1 hypothetical protein, variant [Fonticula alba]
MSYFGDEAVKLVREMHRVTTLMASHSHASSSTLETILPAYNEAGIRAVLMECRSLASMIEADLVRVHELKQQAAAGIFSGAESAMDSASPSVTGVSQRSAHSATSLRSGTTASGYQGDVSQGNVTHSDMRSESEPLAAPSQVSVADSQTHMSTTETQTTMSPHTTTATTIRSTASITPSTTSGIIPEHVEPGDSDEETAVERLPRSRHESAVSAYDIRRVAYVLTIFRNKRCLAAYVRSRASLLLRACWQMGGRPNPPPALAARLSRTELDLWRQYASLLADMRTGGLVVLDEDLEAAAAESDLGGLYGTIGAARSAPGGGQLDEYDTGWLDLDLMAHEAPPQGLFVEVRVLRDCGSIQTEDGVVHLTENSNHFLPRSAVEHLISQGYLQHIA